MKFKYLIILVILLLVGAGGGFLTWKNFHSNGRTTVYKQADSNRSLDYYYQTARDLKKQQTQSTDITFLAVGDIMLSRDVASTMAKNGKDSFFPFRGLEDFLHETDFNFGNLESPFSGKDNYYNSDLLLFNAPRWAMPGLSQYNFKVLNLANNHAMDQELAGIVYTKKLLTENYLIGIGTGRNLDEAWQGGVYNAKGVRVGFVGASLSSINDGGATKNNYVARIEDKERLKATITDLKTKSDFVVATMHAGVEYTRTPNAAQTDFAHAAIEAGADMVIGAHPHWAQTFEVYKGKYIFYSLGNFVFDQMWSRDTKEGLTLKISLNKVGACIPAPRNGACASDVQGANTPATLKKIELIPVIIENYSTPRLANEEEKAVILKKIGATTSVITP